jgi:hypothetical protein
MALAAKLEVIIAGNASGMNRATREASRSIQKLQKDVGKSVGKINGLFATIGIGLSLSGLTTMAKAAAEDAAALNQMALALKNATGATNEQVTSAEAYIQTLSNQLGIVDDELRPALTTLAQATGDVATAQGLLNLAADIAVDKHMSVEAAAKLVGKAYNGNTTSLTKYYSSAKNAADPLAEVARLTKGAAEAAADSDPFKRLTTIFENLVETLGSYLLPYVQQFADWLSTEQGQTTLTQIADAFKNIAIAVFNIISWLSNNFWLAASILGLIKLVGVFWELAKVIGVVRKAYKEMVILQTIMAALKTLTGPQALILALGAAATVAAFIEALPHMFPEAAITAPIIDPFTPSGTAPPKVGDPNLPTAKTKLDPLKKVNDALKRGITTLKKQLENVRKLIASYGEKFRGAVSLSFGIIERGSKKLFRADRYVRELNRMRDALKDYQSNLAKLRTMGGSAATPLINELLGMSPEDAAAAMSSFVQSPGLFAQAVATTNQLGAMGRGVGRTVSQMAGNQTEVQMLNEIKLLRDDLAKGKNTYNITSTMTATQIVNAIRAWERSTGRRVLVG